MDEVARRTAANRRLIADFFDGLDESQLESQSLCEAWTVRQVLAHLAMPFAAGISRLLWETVRARGSIDRASVSLAVELGRRPVAELTGLLRDHASRRVPAPGVGPMGQLTDSCIHLRDCARPLGLADDVALSDWRMVLDWLPSRQAALGVVPRGRLDGLLLRATDQDFVFGAGLEVCGASEALALGVAGRGVGLRELSGAGVGVLAGRI